MDAGTDSRDTQTFLKSLGFPEVKVHHSFNHFDFSRPSRRILVIGSMGSGKTEFSARIWRDSEVARRKTGAAANINYSPVNQGNPFQELHTVLYVLANFFESGSATD